MDLLKEVSEGTVSVGDGVGVGIDLDDSALDHDALSIGEAQKKGRRPGHQQDETKHCATPGGQINVAQKDMTRSEEKEEALENRPERRVSLLPPLPVVLS